MPEGWKRILRLAMVRFHQQADEEADRTTACGRKIFE